MMLLERAKRAISFAAGDLRAQSSFPWFTTSIRDHLIPYEEIVEGLELAQYGDVGLHRDKGYFTNLVIPGAMKHCWLHTSDSQDTCGPFVGEITEATSDGVLAKSAIVPFVSDYAVLLRPIGVTEEERKGACVKAEGVIGAEYDSDFKFNIEEELEFYTAKNDTDLQEAIKSFKASEAALQRWSRAFSCSELVAYCWWHKRNELRLYRRKFLGKDVILPVDFMHSGFEIVWCSESWTVDIAHKQGLGEEAMEMLVDWKNRG